MKIISIDPGYERLGIAIIEKGEKMKEVLLYSACFKTSAKLPFSARLREIGIEIERLIKEFEPVALAIETLFLSNNQKTAMRVSEVRGAIIYIAALSGLKIYEYSPLNIKIATTGYGKSTKDQIIAMIPKLIKIKKKIVHDDEYDAIAVGITCLASTGGYPHLHE
ncbi:MAG: crossover junction endodeoxyribonuclease RuvC [Candidatus Taylorbacteria bacterium]|nr:crossover junction endodeoxyribonuclease RuvC [Candidatus Taylorbacteria bacterium]